MPVSMRDVTFEDVAVLKHALDSELALLAEKSDVVVALLVGLSGQVLASHVPNDLSSDAYRLMSMVQANIPYMRREIAIGRIQQSISRYETGNVVATRVGTGELLVSVLGKESSVSANLPHIHRCAQILTHISSQKAITQQELSEYGEAAVSVVAPPAPRRGWQPPAGEPVPLSTIALIYAKEHRRHASDAFPENSPGRVEGIVTHLKGARFFDGKTKVLLDAPEATVEQLATVHSREYIEFIRTTSARGPTRLPRSTYMCVGSWQAALAAAGAALKAGGLVQRDYDAAFALTRPAGHHALPDMYGGFCLFNNAAILAKALKAGGRVMVLNWDVHASNGTKHIFYTDPNVLTISIHRNPVSFFPNEGFVEEIGSGPGQGFSINVPMPAGSGDSDYLRVFEAVVRPVHSQFRPRYIVVECGFDAHYQDPLGGMRLSSQGYHLLGQRLLSLQNNRLVLTLEGGYNAKSIGMLAHSLLSSLLGLPNAALEKGPPGEAGRSDPLSYGLVKGSKGERHHRQAEPHSVDLVIEQLRHHLRQWWAL